MIFKSGQHIRRPGKLAVSVFILFLFYFWGLIGLQSRFHDWFLAMTPLNLIVSFLIVARHADYNRTPFIIFSFLIFTMGYLVEVAGVATGVIFGEYAYGPVLGFKVFNVPLLIGLNWLTTVYCTAIVVEKTGLNVVSKCLIGAGFMTAFDYIIEPVAIHYNFWTWTGSEIPYKNYVAWFIFSFLFLMTFFRLKIERDNKVVPWLLVMQIIFFLALNLLI